MFCIKFNSMHVSQCASVVLGYSRLEGRGTHDRGTCVVSGPTQFS